MIGNIGGTVRRTLWIVVIIAVFGGHFLIAAISGLTNANFNSAEALRPSQRQPDGRRPTERRR